MFVRPHAQSQPVACSITFTPSREDGRGTQRAGQLLKSLGDREGTVRLGGRRQARGGNPTRSDLLVERVVDRLYIPVVLFRLHGTGPALGAGDRGPVVLPRES